jgi:hypothetical protein
MLKAGLKAGMDKGRERQRSVVTGLMPTLLLAALWLIMESIPAIKFPSLLNMMAAVCVAPQVSTLANAVSSPNTPGSVAVSAVKNYLGDKKYNHARYFWSCLFALTEVILRRTVLAINNAMCFAILMDSSTDCSGEDHLLIYTQYVNDDMTVNVDYLCTIKVPEKTAASVYTALIAVLGVLGVDLAKLVALATDGGSEYMGSQQGVGVRLKANQCYLMHMHCVAHRAALVMGDQADAPAPAKVQLRDIEQLATDVHSLFNRSSKKSNAFRRFCVHWCPGLVTRFKFPIYNATRWLSRFDCFVVLCTNAPALIAFIEKRGQGWEKGQSVLARLKQPDVIATLMGISDILYHVDLFTTRVQRDTLLVHEVRSMVDDLCVVLEALITTNDEGINQYDPYQMTRSANFFRALRGGKWFFRAAKRVVLDAADVDMVAWYATMKHLIKGIVASMRARFPDGPMSKVWRIFDIREYVGMPASVVPSRFNGEFIILVSHYNNGAQKLFPDMRGDGAGAKLLEEFKKYKQIMYDIAHRYPGLSTREAWQLIKRDHAATVPHVLHLAVIMFTIPVQTATVERGFSMHRVIKHRLTNRLRLATLDALMRVKLLGPSDVTTFNFDAATAAINEVGGMASGKHPMLVGRLLQAVSDLHLPLDLAEGIDIEGDTDALEYPSDTDSDDSEFHPGESDDDSDGESEISLEDEEALAAGEQQAEIDEMAEMNRALGLE